MFNTSTNSSTSDEPEEVIRREADQDIIEQEQEEEREEEAAEEEFVNEEDDADFEEEEDFPAEAKRDPNEKKLSKPKSVTQQMQKSGRDASIRAERRPKTSITMKSKESFREVDKPSDQFLDPGQEASRFDSIMGTGALAPYTRKQLLKEYSRMQQIRNAFVIWQAQQDDYIIYQNVGWDEVKQKTRWKPVHYQLYPMTTGQRFKVTSMQADFDDLRRDIANNDKTIRRGNAQLKKIELELTMLKLSTYFRMNVDFDTDTGERGQDDEFEGSSWVDVRDMVEAAEWAYMYVPKSRRIKQSADSGSAAEREEMTIQEQSYGIR